MMDAPESLNTAHIAWNASAAERKTNSNLPDFPPLDLANWATSAENVSKKLRLQADLAANLITFAQELEQKRLKS
jgi:hypothetical protein